MKLESTSPVARQTPKPRHQSTKNHRLATKFIQSAKKTPPKQHTRQGQTTQCKYTGTTPVTKKNYSSLIGYNKKICGSFVHDQNSWVILVVNFAFLKDYQELTAALSSFVTPTIYFRIHIFATIFVYHTLVFFWGDRTSKCQSFFNFVRYIMQTSLGHEGLMRSRVSSAFYCFGAMQIMFLLLFLLHLPKSPLTFSFQVAL